MQLKQSSGWCADGAAETGGWLWSAHSLVNPLSNSWTHVSVWLVLLWLRSWPAWFQQQTRCCLTQHTLARSCCSGFRVCSKSSFLTELGFWCFYYIFCSQIKSKACPQECPRKLRTGPRKDRSGVETLVWQRQACNTGTSSPQPFHTLSGTVGGPMS